MRAPRYSTGPRRASDSSNTGGKSKAAPAKPTSKPLNKMPTRSVGKPVGNRVGRSTPTTRSKPSTPKQYTRRVDSRGNVSSTPTRKTTVNSTSAPSVANKRNAEAARAANKRNAAKDSFFTSSRRSLAQKPTAAPARPTRAPARPAQTRRPTTSSRSSPDQKPAGRRRNPMTGRRSAHLSRLARGRRR